jgi:hypothetical protein
VPLSMCRWKSSADDALGRPHDFKSGRTSSAPEAIEDQLLSGGSLKAIVIVQGQPGVLTFRPISSAFVGQGMFRERTTIDATKPELRSALTKE